ncbi:MAG TPA: hypothetical protein VI279_06300 [Rhodocyclaceae bacterium]
MIVLAHRGNLQGPDPVRENSPASIAAAISQGFGIETDLRYAPGFGFYISHDQVQPSLQNALHAHAALWLRNPDATIALNIKETGNEAPLIGELNALGVAEQVFLFDMELIEPVAGEMATRFRALDRDIAIAARVSDRHEPAMQALAITAAETIWLDEFDGPWATGNTVAELIRAGKRVYGVSPDLHGAQLEQAARRWQDFADWGVTGICTDWPLRMASELGIKPA